MNLLKWFSAVWQKLVWVITLIYTYLSPIYSDVVKVINELKNTDLTDEAKRKEAFKVISQIAINKGLKIPDSILNAIIELVYQLIKQGKA